MTPDELLRMSDNKHYELIDGTPVEKKSGALAAWIAGKILFLLDRRARADRLGWLLPGTAGYDCFPFAPDTVRKPDASFVRRGRFPGGRVPLGHSPVPPDLAVEVVAPEETDSEVEVKVGQLLRAGVSLLWVVNPATRTVRVHRLGCSPVDLDEQQELTGDDVVLGFGCRVSDLFPEPEVEPLNFPAVPPQP